MESDKEIIFGLLIIESLRKEDQKTGEKLNNEIIKYKQFKEPILSSFFYRANTKVEFIKILVETIKRIKNENFFPIFHIESHGSDDGIQLSSNETITWNELIPFFREINILLSNRLFINMGVCYALSFVGAIDPSKRAPFRVLIGANNEIEEGELLAANEVFYDNYFFSFDGNKGVELMNKISGDQNKFFIITSEYCFDELVNIDKDPVRFQKLVHDAAMSRKLKFREFEKMHFEDVKLLAETELRDYLYEAKNNKDYFLMKDIK